MRFNCIRMVTEIKKRIGLLRGECKVVGANILKVQFTDYPGASSKID